MRKIQGKQNDCPQVARWNLKLKKEELWYDQRRRAARNDFMLKEGSLPVVSEVAARAVIGPINRVLAVDSSCPTATSLLSLSPKYFPSHEPDVVNIDYVVLLELAHSICARACQCRHSYYIFTNK